MQVKGWLRFKGKCERRQQKGSGSKQAGQQWLSLGGRFQQLDLELLEPTTTTTRSPTTPHPPTLQKTSWTPWPTMAYSGPVIDVRVGFHQLHVSSGFSSAFSVTQLKVTGWKLLGSTSTLLRPNKTSKKSSVLKKISAKSNRSLFWDWFDIILYFWEWSLWCDIWF